MTSLGDTLDNGRLTVVHDHIWFLHRNGLNAFESFYDEALVGKPLRVLERRSNFHIRVSIGGEKTLGLYLKRHEPLSFADRLGSWLRFRSPKTPARIEWDNIARLAELGIPTPAPVALGEDPSTGRSFIVTAEIERAMPADDFARARFAANDPETFHARRHVARRLGALVRRLHAAGLAHRDLYLCHVFVRETLGEHRLHLIDLQRVERFRLGRWRVKDVAALEFSRPPGTFTRTDGVRFLCAYFAVLRLDPRQKRFAAAVLSKAERIRRRERLKDGAR